MQEIEMDESLRGTKYGYFHFLCNALLLSVW
jgi:hypothetical protein